MFDELDQSVKVEALVPGHLRCHVVRKAAADELIAPPALELVFLPNLLKFARHTSLVSSGWRFLPTMSSAGTKPQSSRSERRKVSTTRIRPEAAQRLCRFGAVGQYERSWLAETLREPLDDAGREHVGHRQDLNVDLVAWRALGAEAASDARQKRGVLLGITRAPEAEQVAFLLLEVMPGWRSASDGVAQS